MRELGGKRKAQVFLLLGLVLTSRLTERKTESGFSFRKRACALQTMSASPSAHVCAGGWWERAEALIRLESEKMETYFGHCLFQQVVAVCDWPVLFLRWKTILSHTKWKISPFASRLARGEKKIFLFKLLCYTIWIIRSLIYSFALLHCLTRISDSCLDIIYDDILFWINSCNT